MKKNVKGAKKVVLGDGKYVIEVCTHACCGCCGMNSQYLHKENPIKVGEENDLNDAIVWNTVDEANQVMERVQKRMDKEDKKLGIDDEEKAILRVMVVRKDGDDFVADEIE